MDYNELLESVCEYINEKLDTGAKATVVKTLKNNGVKLCGISICAPGVNASPTIYMENYYLEYLKGMDIWEIGDKVIEIYKSSALKKDIDVDFFSDFEQVKDKLFIKLINIEKNREFLSEVPYEEFQDLAIVAYCDIKNKSIGKGSITLKNSHLKMWDVNAGEVIGIAKENTFNHQKMKIRHILEVLKTIGPCCIKDIDMDEESFPMYIVTNSEGINGAVFMTMPEKLKEMSEVIEGDFFIIPSSIHELIIIPAKDSDSDNLEEIIREVNENHVGREEVLADHPYYYNQRDETLIF